MPLTQRSQYPRCLTSPHLENRSTPHSTRVESALDLGGTKVLNLLHILAAPDPKAGSRPTQRWPAGNPTGEPSRPTGRRSDGHNASPRSSRRTAHVEHRSRSRNSPGRLWRTSANEATEPSIGRPGSWQTTGKFQGGILQHGLLRSFPA